MSHKFLSLSILTAALLGTGVYWSGTLYGQSADSRKTRVTPTVVAVAKAMPGVVNLSTEKIVEYSNSGMMRDLFNFAPDEELLGAHKGYSLGSGSIIDRAGLIVTNAHVVRRAVRINITLNDGKSYQGRIIAADDLNDIALIGIADLPDDANLQPIEMAAPGDLMLGETVIVVGNPYGLGSSISEGVLSAVGRKVTHKGQVIFADILQTDAAVYPGNSGGPLINLNGRMIGINTAILREAKGIGFAIPLQRVENILARWLIPERFSNVSLGLVPAVKREKNGALVFFLSDVLKDSPAWKAGLRPGFIIEKVDGKELSGLMPLCGRLWKMQSGDTLELSGRTGIKYLVKATDMVPGDGVSLAESRLGLKLHPLTEQLSKSLNYPFRGGFVISGYKNGGNDIVKRGDILLQLGDVAIHSASNIVSALNEVHYGDMLKGIIVSVTSEGGRYYLEKKLVTFPVR